MLAGSIVEQILTTKTVEIAVLSARPLTPLTMAQVSVAGVSLRNGSVSASCVSEADPRPCVNRNAGDASAQRRRRRTVRRRRRWRWKGRPSPAAVGSGDPPEVPACFLCDSWSLQTQQTQGKVCIYRRLLRCRGSCAVRTSPMMLHVACFDAFANQPGVEMLRTCQHVHCEFLSCL